MEKVLSLDEALAVVILELKTENGLTEKKNLNIKIAQSLMLLQDRKQTQSRHLKS